MLHTKFHSGLEFFCFALSVKVSTITANLPFHGHVTLRVMCFEIKIFNICNFTYGNPAGVENCLFFAISLRVTEIFFNQIAQNLTLASYRGINQHSQSSEIGITYIQVSKDLQS